MIEDFRQFFIDNFAADIGSYNFRGNSVSVEAIAILPAGTFGYEYPPTDTRVSGIEFKTLLKKQVKRPGLNDEVHKSELRWFCLQQWTGDQDLQSIGDRLSDLLVNNGFRIEHEGLVSGNESLQIKPQYVIEAMSLNVVIFCF